MLHLEDATDLYKDDSEDINEYKEDQLDAELSNADNDKEEQQIRLVVSR